MLYGQSETTDVLLHEKSLTKVQTVIVPYGS